jgi:hypothetical protein
VGRGSLGVDATAARLSHRSGAELWRIAAKASGWIDASVPSSAHARAGLRTLRFSHSQVFHQPGQVRAVLTDTFRRR